MSFRKIASLSTAALASICLGGCTVAEISTMGHQTHYDYPNSNITPLGAAYATYTTSGAFPAGEDYAAMYDAAVASVPGADLVVDFEWTRTVKSFLFWTWNEFEISGTGAEMTVGEQRLR